MRKETNGGDGQEAVRLRLFWNSRYDEFSLSESGIKGLPPKYSELLYRCKREAYGKALNLAGIKLDKAVAILDGGCGQGFFASLITEMFRLPSYTGVDISQKAIDFLKRTPAPGGGEWICGDLSDSSWSVTGAFDVAQSIEVLHLILEDANHRQAITNLTLSLKRNGILIITDTLPKRRYDANAYITFRPIDYYLDLFVALNLELLYVFPMYYCVPDMGIGPRRLRRLCRFVPPELVYLVDRLALKLKLPQCGQSHDAEMKMLMCRKRVSE